MEETVSAACGDGRDKTTSVAMFPESITLSQVNSALSWPSQSV
jgi:hypothetical protein